MSPSHLLNRRFEVVEYFNGRQTLLGRYATQPEAEAAASRIFWKCQGDKLRIAFNGTRDEYRALRAQEVR